MAGLLPGQVPIEGQLRAVYADSGVIGPLLDYDEITDVPQFTIDGDVLLITKMPGQPAETLRFVGAVQRGYQVLGIAVGDDTTFADADFGALDTHPDDAVTILTFTGDDQHLAIWYAGSDLQIDIVQLLGSPQNHISEFLDPVALRVGVVDGFYIATRNPIQAARSGAKLLAYNTTGLSTFTRYGALRAAADGSTFVASDFTGSNGFSSTTAVVEDTRTAPDTGQLFYQAVAVPDAQLDVSGIFAPGFSGYEQQLINLFERQPGTITINGSAYKVWRSTVQFNDIGSMNVLIRQEPKL